MIAQAEANGEDPDVILKMIEEFEKENSLETRDARVEQGAQQQQDVPLVVVKATDRQAKRDKSSDILVEALASVKKIEAMPPKGSSKQGWNIMLSDGSKLKMDFTTRTNKVGAMHKMGQFSNLAVKFNKVASIR